jgi:hypothetical protein
MMVIANVHLEVTLNMRRIIHQARVSNALKIVIFVEKTFAFNALKGLLKR